MTEQDGAAIIAIFKDIHRAIQHLQKEQAEIIQYLINQRDVDKIIPRIKALEERYIEFTLLGGGLNEADKNR